MLSTLGHEGNAKSNSTVLISQLEWLDSKTTDHTDQWLAKVLEKV